MNYEIQSRSDLFTGVSLVVRIQEEELDKKALYTIQTDKPDFILPFHWRYVDGQVEFVYQVGTNSKLQYLSGERLPKEYAGLWTDVFRPLLDCGDWFLNPYSFVLSAQHLYYDKNTKAVSYVYIPSIRGCSGYAELKEMAIEVSRLITVCDADLENKVLRAVIKDFNPTDFMRMLKPYISENTPFAAPPMPAYAPVNGVNQFAASAQPYYGYLPEQQRRPPAGHKPSAPAAAAGEIYGARPQAPSRQTPDRGIPYEMAAADIGDIVISIPENGKANRKTKEKSNNKEDAGRKKEKQPKEPKSASGLLGGKKDAKQDAARNVKKDGKLNAKQEIMQDIRQDIRVEPAFAIQSGNAAPPQNISPVFEQQVDPADVTQCVSIEANANCLRFIGSALMPQMINVNIDDGGIFTIGRFDSAIGRQQSSFEFDKKTKAVSRRHAVIERHADAYSIIDLSSSAGTFLNGNRMLPNNPCQLSRGSRVSFGNAGADYIWEGN